MSNLPDAEADLLRASARPLSRLALVGAILIPLFFLLNAVGELYVVSKIAKIEDRSFWFYVEIWYEPAPSLEYSGLTLVAVKRLNSSFFALLIAGVFAASNASILSHRRKLARALSKLEATGALRGSRSDA